MDRNTKRCFPALKSDEIADIVNSIFKYKENGTLQPREVKKRKVIFGKECGMSPEEKQDFVNKQIGDWKKEKTKQTIYNFIEQYSGKEKITAKFVAQELGIGIATVKRYWFEFKEFTNQKNKK